MKTFIQIGTNDGKDTFREIVKKENPDLVILVEPIPQFIDQIKKSYLGISNVHIINKAIYYEDNKEVSLYIPAINKIYGNKGENGFTYNDKHFSLVPMNDWGDKSNMIEIKSQSITFDTLCKEFNITDIDFLQMDTEGFDSEILKMIDLDKYNIKRIKYEQWGFDPSCFTRFHNENANNLGKNGMKQIEEKLIKYNYNLQQVRDYDGSVDILATKQN